MTWEPTEFIKIDDPVTLEKYAEEQGLLKESKWKWSKIFVKSKIKK